MNCTNAAVSASMLGALWLSLGATSACSDYSLLEATPRPDGGTPDDAGTQGLSPACDACLRAPRGDGVSCLSPCLGDSKCQLAYTCTTYLKCVEGKRRQDAINCALPCGQNARIGSLEDPSGKLLVGVLDCGIATCSQLCALRP